MKKIKKCEENAKDKMSYVNYTSKKQKKTMS